MRIVLRIPKRQVRLAAASSLLVALGAGAGVAAQPDVELLGGDGAAETLPVPALPHDRTLDFEQHPEERLKAAPDETLATEPVEVPATAAVFQESQPLEAQAQQPVPPVQDPATPPAGQQQGTPPPVAGQANLSTAEQEALDLVEQMIRDQEGVLMGSSFDYLDQGRRDPFSSLLVQINAVNAPSVRPPGVPGFLISEVDLKGIAAVNGRWHAMIIGANQRAYFIEVGTELFDGHVVDIRPGEVIFEQVVTDTFGARRTREVTKRLRTDGGGETP